METKKIGASYLSLGAKCPGSVKMRKMHRKETQAMSDGTKMHELIECYLETGNISRYPELENDFNSFASWYFLKKGVNLNNSFTEYPVESNNVRGIIDYCGEDENGDINVIDWKYGKGQRFFLPPIDQDWQMIAYAIMYGGMCWENEILIRRVRVSDLEEDVFFIDEDMFESLEERVHEIAQGIINNEDLRIPGVHCDSCLAKEHCPEYVDMTGHVTALVAKGETTLTPDLARQWAVCRGAVKEKVAQLDQALRDYIEDGGEVVESGKKLTITRGSRTTINDVDAAIEALKGIAGDDANRALEIVKKTTKGKIADILKEKGVKGKDQEEFFNRLGTEGVLKKYEIAKGLRWKNV